MKIYYQQGNTMKKINNIILDVDGTLTNGMITYTSSGDEIKSFSAKDGMAISLLNKNGVDIYIITGRKSKINQKRFKELGVSSIYEGIKDKKELLKNLQINFDETLYMGDDINDLEAMKICKYKACPADAVKDIKEIATDISIYPGGDGAFREIADKYFNLSNFRIEKGEQ